MEKLSEDLPVLVGRSIHYSRPGISFGSWMFLQGRTQIHHIKRQRCDQDRTRIRNRNVSAITPNQDPYTIDEKHEKCKWKKSKNLQG